MSDFKRAMLFAAGLGTRMGELTANTPKALVKVNGKTLLERNILYLKSAGIRQLIVNVHHFADSLLDFLQKMDNFGLEILISDERSELLETGGGLLNAFRQFPFEGNMLVMNVDILSDLNLHQFNRFHCANNNAVSLAVRHRGSSRYFLLNTQNELCGWENIRTGERVMTRNEVAVVQSAFSGISIVSDSFIRSIKIHGRFSIVQALLDASVSQTIKGFFHDNSYWFDVGSPEKLSSAELFFRHNNIS